MIPLVLGLLLLILFNQPANAASLVVLNEIYPNTPSGINEWVEVYNTSSQTQTLTNWKIKEKTAAGNDVPHSLPTFQLAGQQSCYYGFSSPSLNNTNDTVSLVDSSDLEMDSYPYTTTVQGKSFARVPDGGAWASSVEPSQSVSCALLTSSTTPTTTPTQSVSVSLSEYMAYPPKNADDWVELYNNSPVSADLSEYQLDDINGGSSPLVLPVGTIIPGNSYLTFYLDSKLNNSGDTLRFLKPSGEEIESTVFADSIQGTSFAKNSQGVWQQTSTPTPNAANQISQLPTSSPTISKITTPTKTVSKASTSPTPTKTTAVVLGEKVASPESSPSSTTHIYLDNQSKSLEAKPLVKESSYSKYLSWGLISLGILVIGTPLLLFLKKKYG